MSSSVAEAERYFGYYDYELYESFPYAEEADEVALAPLVSVVGASGGVGRSSLALASALLSAASGIDTVLVEGDLQFGDYGFWLGLNDDLPTLGDPKPYAPIELMDNLILYKAPLFPEVAEEVSDSLALGLDGIRAGRGLVIADSGGFWSGFTAHLLMNSDLYLLMVDQRPCSLAGAIKAMELMARLGIPSTRMVVVYNRSNARGALSVDEVRKALGVQELFCLPAAKSGLEEEFRLEDLVKYCKSGSPFAKGVRDLLTGILPRAGHLYADAPLRGTGVLS